MTLLSWPLQQALFVALTTAPAVTEIVGTRVLDEPLRPGPLPSGPSILIGDEAVTPWSTATESGAEHRIEIALVAQDHGFGLLKQLAAAVVDTVLGPLPLKGGRVVSTGLIAARTRRETALHLRRIDLTFRVVLEDDAPFQGG